VRAVRIAVVYVHGLWMNGLEGTFLRWRLAKELDAATPMFAYRSIGADIAANARALAKRLSRLRADTLHLVGHSLGGLVICKMLENGGDASLPPGRVVLLGSPVAGSRAASNLAAWKIGRFILGRTARDELLVRRDPRWAHNRELGVIAGTLRVGLGRIVNTHPGSSDGTVYVDETLIPGMKEHLTMHVSHTGLPFSAAVAAQTAAFLRQGRFNGVAAQR
jgi:pimeloyl-ACP methyl ester carboxylesterase